MPTAGAPLTAVSHILYSDCHARLLHDHGNNPACHKTQNPGRPGALKTKKLDEAAGPDRTNLCFSYSQPERVKTDEIPCSGVDGGVSTLCV